MIADLRSDIIFPHQPKGFSSDVNGIALPLVWLRPDTVPGAECT